MLETDRLNSTIERITQSVVIVYQVLAILVFIASLLFAYDWLRSPFIGGFFEQTMALNDAVTREAGKQWALHEKGFQVGDQLISVAGTPISSAKDLHDVLASKQVGDSVHVVARTLDAGTREADVTLRSLSPTDQISFFAIPAFLSLVFLLIGLWIFGLRRSEP
ncbi:MAG TPA: hypothetical protein VFY26_06415, partial [Anaerolineales bacterium]|nr:hypothetical protein [Anaerolineales bacterium]